MIALPSETSLRISPRRTKYTTPMLPTIPKQTRSLTQMGEVCAGRPLFAKTPEPSAQLTGKRDPWPLKVLLASALRPYLLASCIGVALLLSGSAQAQNSACAQTFPAGYKLIGTSGTAFNESLGNHMSSDSTILWGLQRTAYPNTLSLFLYRYSTAQFTQVLPLDSLTVSDFLDFGPFNFQTNARSRSCYSAGYYYFIRTFTIGTNQTAHHLYRINETTGTSELIYSAEELAPNGPYTDLVPISVLALPAGAAVLTRNMNQAPYDEFKLLRFDNGGNSPILLTHSLPGHSDGVWVGVRTMFLYGSDLFVVRNSPDMELTGIPFFTRFNVMSGVETPFPPQFYLTSAANPILPIAHSNGYPANENAYGLFNYNPENLVHGFVNNKMILHCAGRILLSIDLTTYAIELLFATPGSFNEPYAALSVDNRLVVDSDTAIGGWLHYQTTPTPFFPSQVDFFHTDGTAAGTNIIPVLYEPQSGYSNECQFSQSGQVKYSITARGSNIYYYKGDTLYTLDIDTESTTPVTIPVTSSAGNVGRLTMGQAGVVNSFGLQGHPCLYTYVNGQNGDAVYSVQGDQSSLAFDLSTGLTFPFESSIGIRFFAKPTTGEAVVMSKPYVLQDQPLYACTYGCAGGDLLDGVVGINDISNVSGLDLRLFPNPATSRLTVSAMGDPLWNANLRVVDGLGRTVHRTTGQSGQQVELDLLGISPGYYRLLVEMPGYSKSMQVVILR